VVLSEDQAGRVGAVPASRPEIRLSRHQRFEPRQACSQETGMGQVDGPIQDGDADLWIPERLRPKIGYSWDSQGQSSAPPSMALLP
jgi:hypothetical protein